MKLSAALALLVLHIPQGSCQPGIRQGARVSQLFTVDEATCGDLAKAGTLQRRVDEAASDSYDTAGSNDGVDGDVARAYWQAFFKINPKDKPEPTSGIIAMSEFSPCAETAIE